MITDKQLLEDYIEGYAAKIHGYELKYPDNELRSRAYKLGLQEFHIKYMECSPTKIPTDDVILKEIKYGTMTKKDVIDAWVRIRTIDQTIPDEVLDFMKDCAIEKLKNTIDNSLQVGYWFYDEYGHEVTVLHIFNEWCIVSKDEEDEPYILPLEFVEAIKRESDEVVKNTIS